MANIDYAGLLTGISNQNQRPSPFTSPSRDQQLLGFAAKQNEALTGRLGGMFGLQQQDPVELAKTKLVGLDPTNPADQAQFIQLLNIVDPAKAAQFKQQLEVKKVTDAEKDAAKKLAKERFAIERSDKAIDQGLKRREVAAEEARAAASSLKTLKVERYDPVTQKNVTELVLQSNPTVVVSSFPSPQDPVKQSVTMQKFVRESSDKAKLADERARDASKTAQLLEEYKPTGGFAGTFEEIIKTAGGTQDEASLARTRGNKLVQSEAINSLPQGPATDVDVALARQGEPPADAGAEYLASYARGLAKIAREEANYYRDQTAWYSLNNTPYGFDQSQEIKMIDRTFEGFKTPTQLKTMQVVRESYGTSQEEDNRLAFEKEFGFDLKSFDDRYSLAKQVVEKVTGGN